jgi:acyl carrier protein
MIRPDNDLIEERVRGLIAQEFKVDKSLISYDSEFKGLGRDSLAVLELLALIENEFDISISDEEARQISSFRSLVDSITEHLRAKQKT